MTRLLLGLLAGIPLAVATAGAAALAIGQVRRGFDADLVVLMLFFAGLAAILATALSRWMRDPCFRVEHDDGAIEPERRVLTARAIHGTYLGLALGLLGSFLVKALLSR